MGKAEDCEHSNCSFSFMRPSWCTVLVLVTVGCGDPVSRCLSCLSPALGSLNHQQTQLRSYPWSNGIRRLRNAPQTKSSN